MDELKFAGNIINGIGKHVELFVPGRNDIPTAPDDWPAKLFPGSLNVRIVEWPEEFVSHNLAPSAKVLDTAGFAPALTIPQNLMGNNQLTPIAAMPHKGTAQVWRATLEIADQELFCWVLRRFGSGLSMDLELVSDIGIRTKFGLTKDREWPAIVRMYGQWQS